MTRTLQIAHLCVLLAVIAFLGGIGWRAWKLADEAESVLSSANGAVSGLSGTEVKLNGTLDALNKPCVRGDCGAIPGIAFAAREAVVAEGQIENIANTEKHHLPEQYAQEKQLYADAHGTLTSLMKTADAATGALGTLKGLIAQLTTDAATLQTTEKSLTALIDEAKPIAANLKGMTSDGHRITKDAADEADKLAHPLKKKLGFWGALAGAGMWAHKWLMPSIF